MEQRENETLLLLALRGLKFATDHPYAATGIFGAAVGSAITYRVMMLAQQQSTGGFFTPKIYKIGIPTEELQHLLADPTHELRWETSETTVIISSEEPEPMKQLPVIEGTGEDIE